MAVCVDSSMYFWGKDKVAKALAFRYGIDAQPIQRNTDIGLPEAIKKPGVDLD